MKGKRASDAPVKAAVTRTEGNSPAPANGKLVFGGSKTQAAPAPATQSLFDSEPAGQNEEAGTPQSRTEPEAVRGVATPAASAENTASTTSVVADSVEWNR